MSDFKSPISSDKPYMIGRDLHLGPLYTAQDMYRDYPDLNLKPGQLISVEIGGKVFTDTITEIRTEPARPPLSRWRRIIRKLTPARWRKPYWTGGGVVMTVGSDPLQRHMRMMGKIQATLDHFIPQPLWRRILRKLRIVK